MKQLHVLVIAQNKPAALARDTRVRGHFSYAVTEFTWDFVTWGDFITMDAQKMRRQYSFIALEDSAGYGELKGGTIPAVYFITDSTLSEDHYKIRLQQASRADVLLVDHDSLDRFAEAKKSTHRFPYCVNDKLFHDYGEKKSVDVAFHCGRHGSPERQRLRVLLSDVCAQKGYCYKSKALPLLDYAPAIARARVVVNWPRTPTNRPHRVFDAMAAGAALVTGKVPAIGEDNITAGVEYISAESLEGVAAEACRILDSGEWKQIAAAGYQSVMQHNVWSVRAAQLREIVNSEFGL